MAFEDYDQIPIVEGRLDFSGVALLEEDDADHADLFPPDELLELYVALEIEGILTVPEAPRGLRGAGIIGMSPFVSRAECGLRSPRSVSRLTKTYGNAGHWEGPKMGWPWDHSLCASKVRGIQAFHFSKGWADIAYSSIECGHGYIFECRWFGVRTAANGTNAGNDGYYAHCALVGVDDPITNELKRAQHDVVHYFQDRGSGTTKKTHDQFKPTACNGSMRQYWRDGLPRIEAPAPPPPPTPVPPPDHGEDPDMAAIDNLPRLDYGSGFSDNDPYVRHFVRQVQLLMFAHAAWPAEFGLEVADGKFGNQTKWFLAIWQDKVGLKAKGEQGFVGPLTYRHMYGLPY